MKYFTAFLILILSIVACKNKSTTDSKSKNDLSIALTDTTNNFTVFFGHFKTDSTFQVSHISFPVFVWSYQFEAGDAIPDGHEDDLIIIDTLTLANYTFFRFEDRVNQPNDNYKHEVIYYGDSATVITSGIDNGILIHFDFKKTGNDWKMSKFTDYSN